MGPSGKDKVNLNQRECELLVGAWLSLKNPQIDYEIFANFLGLEKAKSARNAFIALRKRFQDEFGAGYTVNAPAKDNTTKPSTAKKKKASEMLGDDTRDDQFDTNPLEPAAKKVKQDTHDPGQFVIQEGYYYDYGRI
ncbi:hypothetical protein PspLS_11675 [Pyricularia sp. CBS 133598]|nr:hypothetical protein PspLS_11675 [Pyricularia sp. CBS 133598]